MGKDIGLEDKYIVHSNDSDHCRAGYIDAIVLEWSDPIARKAIYFWVCVMEAEGYEQVYRDVMAKLQILDPEGHYVE